MVKWIDDENRSVASLSYGECPIWLVVTPYRENLQTVWYPSAKVLSAFGSFIVWSGVAAADREAAKDAAMQGALSWLRAQVAGLENMARRVPLVPDADDCARPPRDICEGAMTATAERLLWPPPAMCEGERFGRSASDLPGAFPDDAGVWSTLPALTRIQLAVLMAPCKLGWVAVYSGPPVEALRPVCDGRAQTHEECFGEEAV